MRRCYRLPPPLTHTSLKPNTVHKTAVFVQLDITQFSSSVIVKDVYSSPVYPMINTFSTINTVDSVATCIYPVTLTGKVITT